MNLEAWLSQKKRKIRKESETGWGKDWKSAWVQSNKKRELTITRDTAWTASSHCHLAERKLHSFMTMPTNQLINPTTSKPTGSPACSHGLIPLLTDVQVFFQLSVWDWGHGRCRGYRQICTSSCCASRGWSGNGSGGISWGWNNPAHIGWYQQYAASFAGWCLVFFALVFCRKTLFLLLLQALVFLFLGLHPLLFSFRLQFPRKLFILSHLFLCFLLPTLLLYGQLLLALFLWQIVEEYE